ncbi:hypothetical protein EYF80_031461 [Liparis tanakae]|uniref:Uncharacterized protein n=1 Tax=Liparis tanakae TaxID=230148 RepID=A0A4Z2GY16_9TELE|nr:hypothetical protein EYF80_031461 [Liparis tanakae]
MARRIKNRFYAVFWDSAAAKWPGSRRTHIDLMIKLNLHLKEGSVQTPILTLHVLVEGQDGALLGRLPVVGAHFVLVARAGDEGVVTVRPPLAKSWPLGHEQMKEPSTFSHCAPPHTPLSNSHSFTSVEKSQKNISETTLKQLWHGGRESCHPFDALEGEGGAERQHSWRVETSPEDAHCQLHADIIPVRRKKSVHLTITGGRVEAGSEATLTHAEIRPLSVETLSVGGTELRILHAFINIWEERGRNALREGRPLLRCSPLQLVPLTCRYPWGQTYDSMDEHEKDNYWTGFLTYTGGVGVIQAVSLITVAGWLLKAPDLPDLVQLLRLTTEKQIQKNVARLHTKMLFYFQPKQGTGRQRKICVVQLEPATQSVLGGDRLVLGDLVAVLAGIHDVVSVMLDLLAALGVVIGVAGGGRGARLGTFELVPVVVVVVQLGHLVDLDRGLWRVFDVDVDDAGLARAPGSGLYRSEEEEGKSQGRNEASPDMHSRLKLRFSAGSSCNTVTMCNRRTETIQTDRRAASRWFQMPECLT